MSSDNTIIFNIGGTVFEVKKTTLMKIDEYFKSILKNDVPVTKDEFGRIFIDQSPERFQLILNMMSDDDVALSDSDDDDLENQKEAHYNQLKIFGKLCDENIPKNLQKLIEKSEKNSIKVCFYTEVTIARGEALSGPQSGLVQTTKYTLTKFDGFFKTIMETNIPVTKDDSGCIIINRDPKHFETILNYMRGDVEIPKSYDENIQKDIQEVMQEADYYCLDGLVKLCKENTSVGLPGSLKIKKSEKKFEKLIKNFTGKPLLIIDYFADFKDRAFPSDVAEFSSIAERNKEKFEIYFKPFHTPKTGTPNPTSNSYRIFENEYKGCGGNLANVDDGIRICIEGDDYEDYEDYDYYTRWDYDDYDDDPFKNNFYGRMW